MIIPLNWLKQYTKIDMPVSELAVLIGSRLVEIEDVTDLGARYTGIKIAEIVDKKNHDNADKLDVYQISVGEGEPVQVVSGDKKLQVGDKVAWIAPGQAVPSTFEAGKPVVMEARDMRGETSNGMLGSGKELGLNANHDSVAVLDTDKPAGTLFADAYDLNDYLLHIENKSLTHRPDTFGIIGFAREVAAILGQQFATPAWLQALEPVLASAEKSDDIGELTVRIENSESIPRYQAVVISGVDAQKQSPLAIQSYLMRVGTRPISAIVDITNYLMLVTGQPLHAFDYDRVVAEHPEHKAELVARLSREGEKLELLDGRTITLSDKDIVICAGDKPIALGGAMGGATTEVSHNTKNLIIESASFDLYRLRSTSMRHGVTSEAVTRFTKGQSAVQTAPVLASAVRMIQGTVGGKRVSEIVDEYPVPQNNPTIELSSKKINRVLGATLQAQQIADPLCYVECKVDVNGDILRVTAPYWRADLHIAEDLIEEVARITGYDNVTPVLPERDFTAVEPTDFDKTRSLIRTALARAGANEILTYSFVHGKLLKAAGQDESQAFRITNAISPDLQYFRTSLLPSLLAQVHPNIKLGNDSFALFEMNKVYVKSVLDPDEHGLPLEENRLAFVASANDKYAEANFEGAPYYHAKKQLDWLLKQLHITYSIEPLGPETEPFGQQCVAPFEPKRTGKIVIDGETVGFIGELKRNVARALKLPNFTAGFEVNATSLHNLVPSGSVYKPLSKFPSTQQDVCLKVPSTISYQTLFDEIKTALAQTELLTSVEPVDIYQREDDHIHKQITYRLNLQHPEKTLNIAEVNNIIDAVVAAVAKKIDAERV